MFSIYSHAKVERIWQDGNPFAWHLHLEARLIYASDNCDHLSELGPPAEYTGSQKDCERFFSIFKQARESARRDVASIVFDLSTAFLGLRNYSSCYLLGRGRPDFSRNVALSLMREDPPVDIQAYRILERARLLCTRGYGAAFTQAETSLALNALPALQDWMNHLRDEEIYGR